MGSTPIPPSGPPKGGPGSRAGGLASGLREWGGDCRGPDPWVLRPVGPSREQDAAGRGRLLPCVLYQAQPLGSRVSAWFLRTHFSNNPFLRLENSLAQTDAGLPATLLCQCTLPLTAQPVSPVTALTEPAWPRRAVVEEETHASPCTVAPSPSAPPRALARFLHLRGVWVPRNTACRSPLPVTLPPSCCECGLSSPAGISPAGSAHPRAQPRSWVETGHTGIGYSGGPALHGPGVGSLG